MSRYGTIGSLLLIVTWVAWNRDKTPRREDGAYVSIKIVAARNLPKRDVVTDSDPFAIAELWSVVRSHKQAASNEP